MEILCNRCKLHFSLNNHLIYAYEREGFRSTIVAIVIQITMQDVEGLKILDALMYCTMSSMVLWL